jgi:sugar phosphate isomerase/epimerase
MMEWRERRPANVSRTNRTEKLVISSYTLGEQVSFEDRVRVAAEAGFAGIGLRAENYVAARDAGLDDTDMKAILDSYGITVMEVEYLTGWGTEADRDAEQRDKEQTVFHLARRFGAGHMNAGLLEKPPLKVVTDGFAALCRRAGDVVVGLEFMPYSGVPDLATAWEVISAAEQPNSGLLIDAWHWSRSGITADELAPVPAERIIGIQLCDVREQPMDPLRQESLHHRLPPGHGSGDVVGMLRALWAKGVDAQVSVEVISDELLARGLAAVAATVMAAAQDVLAASRRSEESAPAGS